MRKIWAIVMICFFASCDLLTTKDKKTEKLVSQEMQSIDWNDVDQYPLFSDCDETATKTAQKRCFEETLLLHISMTLEGSQFTVDKEIKDTIYVDFISQSNSTITILNIFNSDMFGDKMPEFNDRITQSLNNLPKIEPALKRGIPISAKFRIPIVLNTK